MTKTIEGQVKQLEQKIEFNRRIHCHYVVARLQREINKIREEEIRYGAK